MKVSVIIPAKNSERTIGKCLRCLFNQVFQPYEVIVVDGGSKDRTAEISKSFKGVIVVQEPPHEGNIPAIGRNYGAKIAKGDVFVFLDPDCFPERNLLSKVVETLSDPQAGVYSVIVRDGRGTVMSRAWHYLQMQIDYDYAPTRCMAVRREVFNAVNGFDEKLPTGEDNDFSYRVRQLGYKIIVDKKTIVYHDDEHASSLKGIIHLIKWYRQGEILVRQKYPEKFKRFKTSTPIIKNHIIPLLKSIKDEGPLVALAATIIKIISIVKHL
ncbi:MAG: glycosyltransferase [Candidatus Bathyarchaeia archaeon]